MFSEYDQGYFMAWAQFLLVVSIITTWGIGMIVWERKSFRGYWRYSYLPFLAALYAVWVEWPPEQLDTTLRQLHAAILVAGAAVVVSPFFLEMGRIVRAFRRTARKPLASRRQIRKWFQIHMVILFFLIAAGYFWMLRWMARL